MYQITKKLKGDLGQNCNQPVKDEEGTTLTSEEQKLQRWKEHFQKDLNRLEPAVLADIPEAAEDLDISSSDITLAEMKDAINKSKNGKAPGDNGVAAEMLKAEDQATPEVLRQILQEI